MRDLQLPLRYCLFSTLLAVALFASGAKAQMVGGTISGDVVDPAGAAVARAEVLIRNDETGSERKFVTAESGIFSAPSVSVGTYTVSVTRDGFAPLSRTGIVLTVGQNVQLHLALTVGSVQQSVQVVDTPAVVDTSTLQTQGLVNEQQVKELPLNGRSFDQLIQLNPASVSYTTQRSGGVGTSNSSVGNMFSVSGRRPQDNLFLLNGIEYTGASLINVTPGGTSGQLLGVDAVREFNVVSDTYGANYGKRTGAQISIITASGGNKLHGSVYEFLRNSALDARNYFDQAKIPEFQRNNFGGALGGPIRHDKLFGFSNYEGYRQHLGLSAVSFVPDDTSRAAAAAIVRPLLALWPVANGPELLNPNGTPSGIAEAFANPPQYIREDFGTTRIDTNLTQNDLLFGVYTVDDSDASTPSQNPYSTIYERLREQVLSAQEQHVFSPNLLNTFRFGYSRAAFYFTGEVPVPVPGWVAGAPVGAVVIAGSTASNGASQVTLAGANTGSNNQTVRNLFTVDDHIFWTHGRHQVEVGVWLQRLQSNDNLAQNQYGQASFSTLSSFLKGSVATFTVVPAPTELGWRAFFGAGYIEDAWKATPRLELRAGFRSESTNGWNEAHNRASNYGFTNGVINTNPTIGGSALAQNRATFMPEPRIGVAYDVFGNGKTAVRASFGVHRALLDTLDYRLDQTAPFNSTLSFSNTTVDKLAEPRQWNGDGQRADLTQQCATGHCHSDGARLDSQDRATDRPGDFAHHRLCRFARIPSDSLRGPEHAPNRNLPGVALPCCACAWDQSSTRAKPRPIQTWPTPPPGSHRESATITVSRWMCAASCRTDCSCAVFIPLPATWTMARPGIPASRPTPRRLSCIREILGLTTGLRPPISAMPARSMAPGSCLSATGCLRTLWLSSWWAAGR